MPHPSKLLLRFPSVRNLFYSSIWSHLCGLPVERMNPVMLLCQMVVLLCLTLQVPGETEGEAAPAGKKTIETVKAVSVFALLCQKYRPKFVLVSGLFME